MRDDVEFNVRLCSLVKKYPVLYDMRPGKTRNMKNRIWEAIGSELNENATDCKQRWRQIRGRYWDYLAVRDRQSTTPIGKMFTLTYYLASRLQFLERYMLPGRGLKGTQAKRAILDTPSSDAPLTNEKTAKAVFNKDMKLLEGAIPDMKGLNRVQNRRFKIGFINLMTRVMEQQKARKLLLQKLQD